MIVTELVLATLLLDAQARFTPAPRANQCPPGSTFISGCLAPSEPTPPEPTGCQGTQVPQGGAIQAAIDNASNGATICLSAGLYRVDKPVTPKQGQTVQGQAGTIVSGAKELSGWSKNGTDYVANAFLPSSPATDPDNGGRCDVQNCQWREDVFKDGAPMKRVFSRSSLTTNAYFPDYGANKVYMRDNPSGHVIEQSFASGVFKGTNQTGVTLKTMTVQMSANPEQIGAVDCQNYTSGWTIDGLEIRLGHGVGIVCDSFTMRNTHVHHNGQMGVGGHGNNILVEDTEIDHNNFAGYNAGWEGGGTKFSAGCCGAENGVVRRSNVHHNAGAGLWCDINCYRWRFEGNTVTDNRDAGIFYEISHTCTIVGNTVVTTTPSTPNGFYEQANNILISASPNCEVMNNIVSGNLGIGGLQQNRSGSAGGASGCAVAGKSTFSDGTPMCTGDQHILSGMNVHDNDVTPGTGESLVAGISQDTGDNGVFTSRSNRFTNNRYHGLSGRPFTWDNRLLTEPEWNGYGQH